ncbi:prolipoprotein diacylglyceryl transferase [Butyrivibrio sp.]|uniref:prolipoprotein diacylglyceryl transferase n=1 Tax=Butyrivibrio sp. TaxID=28121 RepID=UPI0025BE49B6|nr:prolipoprotein diacylglyceryl transferase [Butyrivibrio sp.]MBE5837561.1 prolipoprotein diacylglyceryl transferase [Butyrivibrio sp.]MBQ6414779.1 prolipoprotein diacylglyceryl transferase [Butyrivibrio sp.]
MPDIMGKMDIAFPHLNIYLENVPKSFTVFGFSIALYGVIIGLGFFLALILISKIAGATGQNPDTYWDVATFVIVFSIIGARIYYVFFAWDYYKDNPISVFNIRNGGLAIYGGVIAGFLTAFIYCRIKKVNFFLLTDTIMPGLLLGQVMGRWGNFTNREAFGEYTDNLFAMRLPVEAVRSGEITELMKAHMVEGTNYIQVSPTFLYESMWNLCLLIIILLYIKHKKFDGEIVLLYLGGYGLGRFWIEGLRTDQLIMHTTGLPVSQMLAMCLVVFSVTAMIIKRLKMREK